MVLVTPCWHENYWFTAVTSITVRQLLLQNQETEYTKWLHPLATFCKFLGFDWNSRQILNTTGTVLCQNIFRSSVQRRVFIWDILLCGTRDPSERQQPLPLTKLWVLCGYRPHPKIFPRGNTVPNESHIAMETWSLCRLRLCPMLLLPVHTAFQWDQLTCPWVFCPQCIRPMCFIVL